MYIHNFYTSYYKKYQNDMDNAATEGDVFEYKNAEDS